MTKLNKSLLILFLTLLCNVNIAQITDTIDVSFDKSVYLIFDDEVTTDFGSQEIIVREANNKVIIQATVENFYETNLLVQVKERFYMFIVRYNPNPKKLLWNYQTGVARTVEAGKSGEGAKKQRSPEPTQNEELIDHKVERDLSKEQRRQDSLHSVFKSKLEFMSNMDQEIFNRGRIEGKMKFILTNMRIQDNVIYFKMSIVNNSKIKYVIDYVDFRVVNKKKIRKNIEQELRLAPIYTFSDSNTVAGKSSLDVIYVLEYFSLEKDKELVIEVWEDNGGLETEGGRKISFSINAKDILGVESF